MSANCACYMVSISSRQGLHYGCTGETHTELFPHQG